MGIFDRFNRNKINDTIFYKEFKDDENNINELTKLLNETNSEEVKKKINNEIYMIKKGAKGEEEVSYEIKNSFIPMLVLHNIRIVVDEKVAQMDFVLITHKFIMVIETKRLNSDISINQYGDFELVGTTSSGKFYKSGIYSPIVQNERHIRILTRLLEKNNLIKKTNICSEIFLSNHRASINRKYAPNNIKDKVHKLDKFTEIVNQRLEETREEMQESKMYEIAKLLVDNHEKITFDYKKKFMLDSDLSATPRENVVEEKKKECIKVEPKKVEIPRVIEKTENKADEERIRESLIEYRKIKAREEKIQAYCIFKNETIENIIKARPNSPQELRKVRGLGEKTVDKYGIDILKIIHNMK